MKKLPKVNKVISTYFAAKRMENAGLLRPGTALMLYSGTTPRTTLPARSYFGRMPAQKKQTRGGGQGGAPAPIVVSDWILAIGTWSDTGVWDDTAMWKDAA